MLAIAAILAAASTAMAIQTDQPYGQSSFSFLKLPLSPRIVALGGAGSALADGAGELDLNPAAPASDSGRLVVGRGYPFSEFQAASSVITWSIPTGGYRILVNARYLGFDKLEGHGETGEPTTAYGAHALKAQAGVAGMLHDLSWGGTVNFAGNSIANANYATAMVNAGLRYRVLTGLYAGLSVLNADFWDSKAQDPNNADPFPPTAVQAGLAYSHAIGGQFAAAVAVDVRARNDEDRVWPMGAELSWKNLVTARVGFPVGEQEPAIAAGLAVRWSRFQFQYAYQGHATLGPGHFWTLDIAY